MSIPEVMMGVGIAGLALWHKKLPFYILASLVLFFLGARWYDTAWEYGVAGMVLAAYCMYRAVMQAVRGEIGY